MFFLIKFNTGVLICHYIHLFHHHLVNHLSLVINVTYAVLASGIWVASCDNKIICVRRCMRGCMRACWVCMCICARMCVLSGVLCYVVALVCARNCSCVHVCAHIRFLPNDLYDIHSLLPVLRTR